MLGDAAGIVDVLAGAAGALAPGRGPMVVELQRDTDDIVAGRLGERRSDRAVHAARHCHDHACAIDNAVKAPKAGRIEMVDRHSVNRLDAAR
jgi:hypothetical protein